MRLYYRALELKTAGFDWRLYTPLDGGNPRFDLVAELLSDDTYQTQECRVLEFIRRGGGCRSTYFNYAKKIRSSLQKCRK